MFLDRPDDDQVHRDLSLLGDRLELPMERFRDPDRGRNPLLVVELRSRHTPRVGGKHALMVDSARGYTQATKLFSGIVGNRHDPPLTNTCSLPS